MAVSPARIAMRRASNVVFVVFCVIVTAIALTALTAILWSLLQKGAGGLNLDVVTLPTPAAGSRGGLRNAIVGSILLCAIGMAFALLIGVMAGTWLAEYASTSRYGAVVRFLNDVLLSAPSILIGVFVWELLVHPFHGFSAVAGGVALAIIAVPVITRTTEDVLRLQPTALRESGVAVGAPFWHVIRTILWRASSGGILTGALLAFARISGETAPLLFTSLNNQFDNFDPHHPITSLPSVLFKPIASLPAVMFDFAKGPYDDLNRLAWTGALIVSGSVLGVTIIARALSREQKRS